MYERLIEDVIEVYRKNDSIIRVKIVCGGNMVNIMCIYATSWDRRSNEKIGPRLRSSSLPITTEVHLREFKLTCWNKL